MFSKSLSHDYCILRARAQPKVKVHMGKCKTWTLDWTGLVDWTAHAHYRPRPRVMKQNGDS